MRGIYYSEAIGILLVQLREQLLLQIHLLFKVKLSMETYI